MEGLLGKKVGMTRVYDEAGRMVPVTVVSVGPCVVVSRGQAGSSGREIARLGFCERKPKNMTKSRLGVFAKAGVKPMQHELEVKLDAGEEAKPGDSVTVDLFKGVSYVDVVGTTKGRGFQGVVKRWRMAGGAQTHGGHSTRRPGSIGQKVDPGEVKKGQHMSGHMGNVRATQKNLRVVAMRAEENLLLIEGSVAGPNGGLLFVKKSKKAGKSV